MFKLSKRSKGRLDGVNAALVDVVKYAITITEIDFGVTEGIRSRNRQQTLYDNGASQTMNSKHLTGDAVDLVAYLGPRISWELPLYFKIANAMRRGAEYYDVDIKWGGAWTCDNIKDYEGSMMNAYDEYVRTRINEGRRYFIDAPHFELS